MPLKPYNNPNMASAATTSFADYLGPIAQAALPIAGYAIGEYVAPGVGGKMGTALGGAAGNMVAGIANPYPKGQTQAMASSAQAGIMGALGAMADRSSVEETNKKRLEEETNADAHFQQLAWGNRPLYPPIEQEDPNRPRPFGAGLKLYEGPGNPYGLGGR